MLQLISTGNVELSWWLNRVKGMSTNVLANVMLKCSNPGLEHCKTQMVNQRWRRIFIKSYLIILCKFACHSLFHSIIYEQNLIKYEHQMIVQVLTWQCHLLLHYAVCIEFSKQFRGLLPLSKDRHTGKPKSWAGSLRLVFGAVLTLFFLIFIYFGRME